MSGHEHQGGETFKLHLRAAPSDVPPYIRLRHVLKQLLRTYEFRAVRVVETTPQLLPPPAPAVGAEDDPPPPPAA